jgi:hypothetical protein
VSQVPLHATIALDPPHELDKHDHHKYLFAKARECAYSDSASPDEAKNFLRKILEFESECASGALVGDKSCDDVLELAETVAHLREKAEKVQQTVVAVSPNLMTSAVAIPVSVFMMALAFVLFHPYQPNPTPFTVEEWVWATKNGYLPTMLGHFVRNGGLDPPTNTPFTMEEWSWALRDGYFLTMLAHFARNGGLDPAVNPPFIMEEWAWAARDGYLPNMLSHFIRNGGL